MAAGVGAQGWRGNEWGSCMQATCAVQTSRLHVLRYMGRPVVLCYIGRLRAMGLVAPAMPSRCSICECKSGAATSDS